MKTPEQIKGAVRNVAKNNSLQPQAVLQMYLFERVLERLSVSRYRDNFILKGGLLISSMLGIAERTTMDMDTTVQGVPMEKDKIVSIMKEILSIDVGDGIDFVFKKIEQIREDDAYNNFRVIFIAQYGKMNNSMKIDITTGDKITPAAIQYNYDMMFEEKQIPVMAYSLETVLAEKYETIIRRNIGSTRARDYYDLYILFYTHQKQIHIEWLKQAVEYTAEKRCSTELLKDYVQICEKIVADRYQREMWENYVKINPYAQGITFDETVTKLLEVAKLIQ